jgi:hypothetical protein
MSKHQRDKRKIISDVVHQILENGRAARADGPSSGRHGRMAQMSSALTQAGTLLAKMDRAAPGRKPSALQALLGSVAKGAAPVKRRSWLFAAANAEMPDVRRIEQLLKASAKDGQRLVLDVEHAAGEAKDDIVCHLPEGASDPVCEPR